MSTHEDFILNTIYYDATVNKYLYRTQMSIYGRYGYPLLGLRSRNFAAFHRENGKIFIYDYTPLKELKYFNELMRNYYEQKVVKHAFVENIEGDVKKYISKYVNSIELTFDNVNASTFIADTILKNVAILNEIYVAAQEAYYVKELTK